MLYNNIATSVICIHISVSMIIMKHKVYCALTGVLTGNIAMKQHVCTIESYNYVNAASAKVILSHDGDIAETNGLT